MNTMFHSDELSVDALLFGMSPEAREERRLIHQVALTDLPILLEGESGTGKERAARWIHSLSPFAAGPFVRLSGNALSVDEQAEHEGAESPRIECAGAADWSVLELAHDGTLYLDEVEEMTPTAQAQLLYVLQEGKILQDRSGETRPLRTRVISSIRLPYGKTDRQTSLRPDFFYSINAATFRMPALRERAGEIPLLAAELLARKSRDFGTPLRSLSAEAARSLATYSWRGNLREFQDILTSYALTGNEEMLIKKVTIHGDGAVSFAA